MGNMKGEWENPLEPLQGQLMALRSRWLFDEHFYGPGIV